MPKFRVAGSVTYYIDVEVEAADEPEARRVFEEDLSLSEVEIIDGDSFVAAEVTRLPSPEAPVPASPMKTLAEAAAHPRPDRGERER